MKTITATEANRDFSKLLDEVVKGASIAVTKHGKVVATVSPAAAAANDLDLLKHGHLAILRRRRPIPGLTRGTREELYED